jgi:hypothetical protein
MEIPVTLPLDPDGFLRRQCPRCERLFKWFHGTTEDAPLDLPDPEVYFCPYCGEESATDQWFTDEQVDYIQAVAAQEALKLVDRELGSSIEALNRSSGGLLKAEMDVPYSNPPAPLVERDDMVAVSSPCHPHEPIKIAEFWEEPIHCLVCGELFTV